jgi:predicted dehydrogenase
MDRRDFLKTGLAAGAVAGLSPQATSGQGGSPSDRLRIAFLGTGARAHQLMDAALALPDLEVAAVCDAYRGRAERGRARSGGRAVIVDDYRRVLDDRAVDAVFIVTPDHWHRQMTLDALAAGKDVYLEKPMTYAVGEGLEIIKAVDASRRILQVGSQGVSSAQHAQAREIIKAGRLGQVTLIRASYNRNSAGGAWLYPIPPDANEQTVNWSQFLGPATKRPFSLERFFRWRCYWDYSGGLATDLFVHLVSWIHYVMDVPMPARAVASGATYRWKDSHEVPDTINAILEYPQGFTVTLACTLNSEAGSESGVEILGTKASLRFRDGGLELAHETGGENNRWVVRSWPQALEDAYYNDPKVRAAESPFTQRQKPVASIERWDVSGEDDTVAHVRAFVEAVRRRTPPVEDARFGHRAAACAHIINQSVKERRTIEWDATKDTVKT